MYTIILFVILGSIAFLIFRPKKDLDSPIISYFGFFSFSMIVGVAVGLAIPNSYSPHTSEQKIVEVDGRFLNIHSDRYRNYCTIFIQSEGKLSEKTIHLDDVEFEITTGQPFIKTFSNVETNSLLNEFSLQSLPDDKFIVYVPICEK